MILKCKNCGGALKYDVEADKLFCGHCSTYCQVEDFDMKGAEQETMDTEIYHCTSCGSELMVNNVESATYCAYCGQPTIVFDRVAKVKRPKYIVPFSISKEQAYEKILARFGSGRFVPQSVKEFTPDIIRGIYIPFMVYQVDYQDKQIIQSYKEFRGETSDYHTNYREAESKFVNVTVDASKDFDDESSQRLEPYDLSKKRPFHEGYLSGYYADCADEEEESTREKAVKRCADLFQMAVYDTIPGDVKLVLDNNPKSRVRMAEQVMLPVWFVMFREKEKKYTVMVNGQTGKIVGTAPLDKRKIRWNFVLDIFLGIGLASDRQEV